MLDCTIAHPHTARTHARTYLLDRLREGEVLPVVVVVVDVYTMHTKNKRSINILMV